MNVTGGLILSIYMQLPSFPFSITDFNTIAPEMHPGTSGQSSWRTFYRENIRIRQVIYSPGYLADHWCAKGHIIYCIAGSMETELDHGEKYLLEAGQVYTVGDHHGQHRTYSANGCTLFIVD
ncbi:MAG TPA: DHCW motif cupin fold protein [Sediminibacterium sp.]|nr:DHCW motif cupin fold protein [Sediminibacterium sp.]